MSRLPSPVVVTTGHRARLRRCWLKPTLVGLHRQLPLLGQVGRRKFAGRDASADMLACCAALRNHWLLRPCAGGRMHAAVRRMQLLLLLLWGRRALLGMWQHAMPVRMPLPGGGRDEGPGVGRGAGLLGSKLGAAFALVHAQAAAVLAGAVV